MLSETEQALQRWESRGRTQRQELVMRFRLYLADPDNPRGTKRTRPDHRMPRPLKAERYKDGCSPSFVKILEDKLHYWSFSEAMGFYSEITGHLNNNELALLGCNDRFWLTTALLNRPDAFHPWLYERAREIEADPDGYLDLWARYHYKSTFITFAGSIQEVMIDPEVRIAIFSNNKAIAHPFVQQIKEEWETNELLKEVYADVLWQTPRVEAPTWSIDKGLTVKRKSNPRECTIEGHGLIDALPTGKHFPILQYDDVITEKNVTNKEQIQKALERVELSFPIGIGEATRKRFAGTRYCSVGESRVLMADWSHKPISQVMVGDMIVGWEKRDGGRYLRLSRVVARGLHTAQPVNRYTLANGRSVTCTEDHRWWRGAHGAGGEYAPLGLATGPKAKKKDGYILKLRELLVPHERIESYDAGWLAGFYDGEGSLALNKGKNRASGCVTFSQTLANPQLVEQARRVLSRLGFSWREHWLSAEGRQRMTHDRCVFVINGGWRERYRFLAQIAPAKRERLARTLFAKLHTEPTKLISVEDAGHADVHWLETETGNYVIEGFCSSNSYADTYGHLIEKKIAIPRLYPATDDGTIDGTPVFLTDTAWAKVLREMRSNVAAQFLQNPIAGKENTFFTKWLKSYWVYPVMMNVYILGDPSMGRSATSDRTALAVVGIDSMGNKFLLDGYCHRMKLAERWQHLAELWRKWKNMPCTQGLYVGYERYGMQTDMEYFDEQMRLKGPRFEITELNWVQDAGSQAKSKRVGRLEPDFRNANFFVPARLYVNAQMPNARWRVLDPTNDADEAIKQANGGEEFHYEAMISPYNGAPIQHKRERECQAASEFWRVFDPLRRVDEDGNMYDVTRLFFEEFRFFPFSPHDDLIDAMSRVYDMDPMPAVRFESVEPEDYVDS